MKKKFFQQLFVVLCLIICLVPSIGMIFKPTNETIGNERETPIPSINNDDGSMNLSYFTQLGDYFEKHYAFRTQAITADAVIQSELFGVSNLDTVVVGTDGWLYYASTIDDYLGQDTLSERELNGIVHNLGIIQSYAESNGTQFLFTIAPNKNTLYPENMPYYYSCKVSDVHNRDLLRSRLAESDVNYLDLFSVFEEQDEVLYFERDSHWNNKGALLAYNEIMTAIGKAHDDYSSADVIRKKDFIGDLSNMLYPAGGEAEYNYYYGAEEKYKYVTDTESVEDSLIKTNNPDAAGSLYMYRDSFGNALLPFFAASYEDAAFTKAFPMILQSDLEENRPDTFVMELVERNIDWLITRPPVLTSPKLSYYKMSDRLGRDVNLNAKISDYSPEYLQISGSVEYEDIDSDSVVYIAVTDAAGKTSAYECYSLSADNDDMGFLAYLQSDEYDTEEELDISVIIQNGTEFHELGSETVKIGGNYEN